jgi:hypothetical protein
MRLARPPLRRKSVSGIAEEGRLRTEVVLRVRVERELSDGTERVVGV